MPLICDVKTSSIQKVKVCVLLIFNAPWSISPARLTDLSEESIIVDGSISSGFFLNTKIFVPQRKVTSAKIIENKNNFKPPPNVERAENVLIFHLAYIAPASTVRSPIMLTVIRCQPPKRPILSTEKPRRWYHCGSKRFSRLRLIALSYAAGRSD